MAPNINKNAVPPENRPKQTGGSRPHGRPFRLGRLKIEHWQMISALLVIFDYFAVLGSYFFALWMRFDGVFSRIDPHYLEAYSKFVPLFGLVCILIFHFFQILEKVIGMYTRYF